MKQAVTTDNLPSLLNTDIASGMKPSNLILTDIYSNLIVSLPALWTLLEASLPSENISHRVMPSHEDHIKFVISRPYQCWYMIINGPLIIGAIYLTYLNEFGIRLFSDFHNQGYEKEAIRRLAIMHPHKRYLMNINPANSRLKDVVDDLGGRLIQHTFEIIL